MGHTLTLMQGKGAMYGIWRHTVNKGTVNERHYCMYIVRVTSTVLVRNLISIDNWLDNSADKFQILRYNYNILKSKILLHFTDGTRNKLLNQ